MLREMLEIKKVKPHKFQVLFLRNDSSQEVEVQNVKQVDFLTIQEHLEQGESIFITSKPSQKLNEPKHKEKAPRSVKTRLATAFYLDSS
jgi:hypothetical protein